MSFLRSDLFRNFAIGFAVGGAFVVSQGNFDLGAAIPQALAAINL